METKIQNKNEEENKVEINLPPEEIQKITEALKAIKQLFPDKQGIYNLDTISRIKFAVLDMLRDLFAQHPTVINTQDIAPNITYHGRRIAIESPTGLSRDAKICIDGKEQRYFRSADLALKIDSAVVFSMEALDIDV